jgi:GNAT superfamily N-acetyltransferase
MNLPHVAAGYGQGRRRTREEIEEKYGAIARGETPTRAYVIVMDGRPSGYVQTYRILDWPKYAEEIGVTDESHGLDVFLGEPDLIGCGVGPLVIRRFVEDVVFAATRAVAVVADPPSSNRRSVRAFEKAGFKHWRTVVPSSPECGDLLMRLERPKG